jgi:pimeloyl-ACP methyl ester carboxylesterase
LRHAARRAGAIPEDVIAIYRANASDPGAATAMLNWYRAAGRDLFSAKDLDAPIETPTLIVWGLDDVALGPDCLEGTERYVKTLRIERLPDVSHWTPEDAPEKVNAPIERFL